MQSHLKMRSIRPTSALFPFNIPTDLLIGSEKFSVIARHSYSAYLSSEHLGALKVFDILHFTRYATHFPNVELKESPFFISGCLSCSVLL